MSMRVMGVIAVTMMVVRVRVRVRLAVAVAVAVVVVVMIFIVVPRVRVGMRVAVRMGMRMQVCRHTIVRVCEGSANVDLAAAVSQTSTRAAIVACGRADKQGCMRRCELGASHTAAACTRASCKFCSTAGAQ